MFIPAKAFSIRKKYLISKYYELIIMQWTYCAMRYAQHNNSIIEISW